MKLSQTDKFHSIFFTASALIAMIDENSHFKPFTFPNVKDLCKKLVRAVEYNSKLLFKGNTDVQATDYAVRFTHLVEKLVNVAIFVNHTLPEKECNEFEKDFNELLKKYGIDEE